MTSLGDEWKAAYEALPVTLPPISSVCDSIHVTQMTRGHVIFASIEPACYLDPTECSYSGADDSYLASSPCYIADERASVDPSPCFIIPPTPCSDVTLWYDVDVNATDCCVRPDAVELKAGYSMCVRELDEDHVDSLDASALVGGIESPPPSTPERCAESPVTPGPEQRPARCTTPTCGDMENAMPADDISFYEPRYFLRSRTSDTPQVFPPKKRVSHVRPKASRKQKLWPARAVLSHETAKKAPAKKKAVAVPRRATGRVVKVKAEKQAPAAPSAQERPMKELRARSTARAATPAEGGERHLCRAKSCQCAHVFPTRRALLMHELRAVRTAARTGEIEFSLAELAQRQRAMKATFHSWAIAIPKRDPANK